MSIVPAAPTDAGLRGPAIPKRPLLAWWNRVTRLYARINQHRVMLVAAGVTYYLLLALAPSLTVFVSLYGLFNDRTTVNAHVNLLVGILPSGGVDIIKDQLLRLTSAPPNALSLALIGSLVLALWSASAGINALFQAMNIAYEEDERRNFFVVTGLALLFTIGAAFAAIITLSVVIVLPLVFEFFYLPKEFEWLVTAVSYGALIAVLGTGLALLYRWGPSRHQGKWHWMTPGTVLTLFATAAISVVFSWYAGHVGNYNASYGSLGAIVGMMTWIWLTVIVVIVGAELNAEAERASGLALKGSAREDEQHQERQDQRRRHDDAPDLQKGAGADLNTFAAQGDQPKDRGERAGHGQVGA
jgi:membrane protein